MAGKREELNGMIQSAEQRLGLLQSAARLLKRAGCHSTLYEVERLIEHLQLEIIQLKDELAFWNDVLEDVEIQVQARAVQLNELQTKGIACTI